MDSRGAKQRELRFAIGDFCEARAQGGWQKARVLKHWDNGNPYRLELQTAGKMNVWGPADSDVCVREFKE